MYKVCRVIPTLIVASLALALHAAPPTATPTTTTALNERIAAAVRQADRTHPLLFATAADFTALREKAESDPFTKAAIGRVLFDADLMVPLPPLKRELEGRRLLSVSRSALHRITTLSLAWQVAHKPEHRDRCIQEMLTVSEFVDWNPSHFLDVAEMTLALAIGYDWLWHELSPAQRTTIAKAILDKGLLTSIEREGWWAKARNNWGQVCHAGMIAGVLALLDQQVELAIKVVQRAVENLPLSMRAYAPNGCYPEGPGYWSYGTDFNVIALDLLEGNLKSDFGLSDLPGFSATVDYLDLVTGPSGNAFNYADGGMGRGTKSALWWLAKRFKRPDSLVYYEHQAFLKYCAARNKNQGNRGDRLFALTPLWLCDLPENLTPQAPLCWSSAGSVPITIQRSSWDNSKALFVGLKAGSPSGPHGHMDAGSFVLDTDGVRWAYDIGPESYHGIESRNMRLWSSAQDSDRWRIFRLNNFSHNTLVIDDQLQRAKGVATVRSFTAGPDSEAVLDLSPVYPNAKSVIRRGTLLANNTYRLRDTLKGLKPGTKVRWGMATQTQPDAPTANRITLRQRQRQLTLLAEHTTAAQWQVLDISKPQNEWDSPNRHAKMVTLEAHASDSGEVEFSVLFIPGSSQ